MCGGCGGVVVKEEVAEWQWCSVGCTPENARRRTASIRVRRGVVAASRPARPSHALSFATSGRGEVYRQASKAQRAAAKDGKVESSGMR